MGRKNQTMEYNLFYCVSCGSLNYRLPRRKGKQREAGHLKRLYCPHCQEDINHAEVTISGPYTSEEFCFELFEGNFDKNGMRINPSWKSFINSK